MKAEQMQYQIISNGITKGYYTPAPPANKNDVNQIKTTLSSATSGTTTPSNNQNQMR